jgi:two-component system, OmpR family, sensor kinase
MRNSFRSTRVRLTLVSAVQFSVVVTAAAVGFWAASSQFEYGAVDASLRAQGNAVRATVEQSASSGTPVLPTRSTTGLPIDSFVVRPDDSLLAQSATALTFSSVSSLVPARGFPIHAELETVVLPEGTMRVLLRQIALPDGTTGGLLLVRPIDDVQFRLVQSALLLVLVGAGLIVACWLLAWRLAGRALAPVRKMSTVARAITEQDLHRRLPEQLPANDEIGQLARTFNTMLVRLESAFNSLQRFTGDAAHELRAPLSIMRTQLEVTMRRPRTEAEYVQSNATLLKEVERLARVADHLLLLARADAGALLPKLEALDMQDLVEEVVDRWQASAVAKGVALECTVAQGGRVMGAEDLLKRLLDNLLDNALRHASRGGEVRVLAICADSAWTVAVSDSGPGVPIDAQPRLFERFSRGDPARSRSTGGAGLGLSICAAIARAHNGSIELATGPLYGATFILHLPAQHGESPEPATPKETRSRPMGGAQAPTGAVSADSASADRDDSEAWRPLAL